MLLPVFCSWIISCSRTTLPGQPIPDEKKIVTFASYGSERRLYESLIEQFHLQYPSIDVQFVDLGESDQDNIDLRKPASVADTIVLNRWIFTANVKITSAI